MPSEIYDLKCDMEKGCSSIAIGISRAKTQAKKAAHRKRIHAIIAKHL
jgi:hypothetical protein